MRADLQVPAYGLALAALHGPQQALERLLAGFAPADAFPPRLPDLERDLTDLGLPPLPLHEPAPEARDAADRLGLMYVLEGAHLGSAVIARELARHLPPGCPRRYFESNGGPERWARFWRFAGTQPAAVDLPRVADAAVRAFGLFAVHLDRCAGVEPDGHPDGQNPGGTSHPATPGAPTLPP